MSPIKQVCQPIKTALGYLRGRDAVHMDSVQIEGNKLFINGSISGQLASDAPATNLDEYGRKPFFPYSLAFSGVMAHSKVELDASFHYELLHQKDTDEDNASSFDEIRNSKWLVELGLAEKPKHGKPLKHYCFSTYDDVFNVICEGYEMIIYPGLPE